MGKFSVQFEKAALTAKNKCCQTYGAHEEINEWLRSLVRDVESGTSSNSADVQEILDTVLDADGEGRVKSPWEYAWDEFRKASFGDKARALLSTISSRRPPWELRVAFETFSFLSGAFSQRVFVYYQINRINSIIVFRQFDNLPGS